jgi:DNA-binding MarR family transcriptional regulator
MGTKKRQAVNAQGIASHLHSAAIHLLRRLRAEDEASGLTPSRLSALSVVVFAGPISMGDLARAEQVRAPTVSRLVRELERDGLVRRKVDTRDARIQWLTATPRGRRVLQAGRARRVSRLAADLRGLSASDRRTLGRAAHILERLTQPAPRTHASPGDLPARHMRKRR